MLAPRYDVPRLVLYGCSPARCTSSCEPIPAQAFSALACLLPFRFAHRPTLVTVVSGCPFGGRTLPRPSGARHRALGARFDTGTVDDRRLRDRPRSRSDFRPSGVSFAGAGEGYLLRFHHNKFEIHSSAANLLFSYGVVGTILFLVFLRCSACLGARLTLLLIPAVSYSLFHQGMRARPFWLLLAAALGLAC